MAQSPDQPRTDRPAIVDSFARTLSDLRQEAGQPSFRQMSRTSGCISHATLHEATRGKRLPTWETTEQFLIACGVDPCDWRGEWSRVDRLVNRRNAVADQSVAPDQEISPVTSVQMNTDERDERDERETAPMPVSARTRHVARRWGSPSSVLVTVLTAVLLLVAGFTAAEWTHSAPASLAAAQPALTSSRTPTTVGSVSCPRAGEPAVRYWSAPGPDDVAVEYRASRAVPLCGTVRPGRSVKVGFTLTNRGAATRSGLRLHMIRSTGDCLTTATDRESGPLELRPDAPYSLVFEFTATQPGECSAEFELRDPSGAPVLPPGSLIPFAVVVA